MTGWKRVLRAVVALGLAVVFYFTVPVQVDEDLALRAAISGLIFLLLTAGVVWQVMAHIEHPDRQPDGLLLILVLAILAFALAFYRLAIDSPGQIVGLETRLDSLYFTMTTLLTVGYGDIHAEGQVARGLVLVQMVFNVAVIATAFSTLSTVVRSNTLRRVEQRRASAGNAAQPGRRRQRKPR
ncbi:MAG: potassium channel family protein [Nocardioides sp.]